MIGGAQIRAARALLGWSAEVLADSVGITRQTIQRLEQHDAVPPSRSQTLDEIQHVLEAAGVEFIGTPDDRPGVRLTTTASKAPEARASGDAGKGRHK
jgi:transcriptional regulator with XRE-family HTH domain